MSEVLHFLLVHCVEGFLMICLAFVPVWIGGQAMTCYNQGNLGRSVWAITIATWINLGFMGLTYLYGRYNFSIVTILSALF